ncbi:MAG TPA: sialidase family protein, partial [Candidatus Limnocylindria bacterium]|nr:sialidase family protein [Candidatus Limnocylindria bacterium]
MLGSANIRSVAAVAVAVVLALALAGPASAFNPDTEVTVGSPSTPFSQNKQNEPWVAIDPAHPNVLAAGANDNIDLEACNAGNPTTCPFTNGVGVTGVTFSLNAGDSWTQPTYTGLTARHCLGPAACVPAVGPIGTLPWYYENGLASDGDPALIFGPRPDGNGHFSWVNGSQLYFANLTSSLSGQRNDTFKGFEGIAVSRTDDVAAAAAGDKSAWMAPVLASKQSSATFSDKEAITADQVSSSTYFGNVYICNTDFRSVGGPPEPIRVTRSTDGGDTWSSVQISQASNTGIGEGRAGGRQGCAIKTDSHGVVYVVWRGAFMGEAVVWLSRSFDGGARFDRPRVVGTTGTVGAFDPAQGRFTFDGVAGARTNSSTSIDIANGAPTGGGATDRVVIGFVNGELGLNHERAMVRYSDDGGDTWSA